jgi:hypothetical protein
VSLYSQWAEEVGGLAKQKVCLESSLDPQPRGPTKSHSGYYMEGGLPSLFLVVMVVTKGVPMLVGLVLGLHHGNFHILGSCLVGRTPKGLK